MTVPTTTTREYLVCITRVSSEGYKDNRARNAAVGRRILAILKAPGAEVLNISWAGPTSKTIRIAWMRPKEGDEWADQKS